jgi:uncharacterized RDD family membrane protein YckC
MLKILLFNFFTRSTFNKRGFDKLLSTRLQSISLDFSYILSLLIPFIIVIIIFIFTDIFDIQNIGFDIVNTLFYLVMLLVIFFVLNKDIFNGQSIGKRIHGYKVVGNNTNELPSDFKLMIRNITIAIWPIDLAYSIINPYRRLGDLIAGTKVIKCEITDPETILKDMDEKKFNGNSFQTFLLSILIALIMIVVSNP